MQELPQIILTVGLPGSGKSTWLAQNGFPSLSTDGIRELLADDATIQTIHARVFATVRYLVRQRLALRRPVTYIDATHLARAERKPYVRLAEWFACEVSAVFFDVPLDVCLERNSRRSRVVPPEAIVTMAARLQVPELSEGFTRITRETTT